MTFKKGNLVFIHDRNAVDVMLEENDWLDAEFGSCTIYGHRPDEGAMGVVVQDYDNATGFVGVRMNYSLVVIIIGAHGLTLISEIAPPQPEYKVGDLVTITDTGELYTTYQSWLKNPSDRTLYDQYNHPAGAVVGTVIQVAPHSDGDGNILLGIRISNKVYIVGAPGVKLVSYSTPAPREISDAQILKAVMALVLDEDRRTIMVDVLDYIQHSETPTLEDIGKQINAVRARLVELQ